MITDRADAAAVVRAYNRAMSDVVDHGGSLAVVARRLRLCADWLIAAADRLQPGAAEKVIQRLDAEIAALLTRGE